ncbi:MAG: outer membrane lipoprotein carrier protein LolA [Alphaproteobacteria bacterium]|nr:outer membrane lipoprotein carrier protein LolA [Alphaproteobacteria bacterium]
MVSRFAKWPRGGGGLMALVVALSLSLALPAQALSERDQADLDRVEEYLNGLTTVAARFMQMSPDGGIATGSFFLSRPGKMRVEYDPPVKILMVATGRAFFFYDGSVKQTVEMSIDDTPAYFLVEEHTEFGKNVLVRRLERADDTLKVTLVQAEQPDSGTVELIFKREPLELSRWSIFDPDGQETRVALLDSVFGAELEERLFLYISPDITGPNK